MLGQSRHLIQDAFANGGGDLCELNERVAKDDHLRLHLPRSPQTFRTPRALATQPKLLLLDEPTSGMNPTETTEMKDLIVKVRRDFGLTILLIEHHMQVVMKHLRPHPGA